jgi:ribosomal-protein-alanine N-acetyltransferase
MQVSFQPFPTLQTERLLLRAISHEDTPEMFRLRTDERVMRYIGRPRPRDMQDITEMIQRIQDMVHDNQGITWAISLKESGKLIGTIGFWQLQMEHYRAEIGYMLDPDFQGRGIMKEALAAAIDYAWNVMKAHTVDANVDPENTASRKFLEKNGFEQEAYFRENFFWNGKFLDTVVYGIVAKN